MNYARKSFWSGASLRGTGRAVNNFRNKTTLTDSGMQIAVERPQCFQTQAVCLTNWRYSSQTQPCLCRRFSFEGQREYAMFPDLVRRYHWVLEPYQYKSLDSLLDQLNERVIARAEAKAIELRNKVAGTPLRGEHETKHRN